MNCQYCHKPLKFSHHENNKEVSVYDCLNCPMLVFYSYLHDEAKPIKTTFMFGHKKNVYMWTNDRIKSYSYIEQLKINEHPMQDAVILKLPKLIDVSPETVIKKFSFYMVFA